MACELKPTMWQPNPEMSAWPVGPPEAAELPRPNITADEALIPYIQELDKIRLQTQHSDEIVKQVEQGLNNMLYQIQEMRKRSHHPQMQSNGQPMDLLQRAQQEISRSEALLHEQVTELSSYVDQLVFIQQMGLERHIEEWNRLQQYSANGLSFENRLERIQDVCEIQADRIWECMLLAQRISQAYSKVPRTTSALADACAHEEGRLRTLLQAFISASVVIEKQPPQVMKTNTRFTTTLRMLIGGRMNIHMSPPTVTVSIISEAQACALAQNENYPPNEASGEILNNRGLMEYNANAKVLNLSFRNMSLKKIKRAEKKGTESVMDEKFCLLFQSVVRVGQMSFAVRSRSLPVVVIVHGNQEPDAWATVTWDNAFSQAHRLPFLVPEAVSWRQMAQVLSMKFRAATGRELSESNLHLLATKAFRDPNLPVDCGDRPITWAQFCKELLPDRTFSFWEWFYAIMKVTREHLRAQWNDGLILGFIGRRETEAILSKKPDGTFLLRFSDSELGGVSIAWVSECDGQKNVLMVQPFTARDFQIRSISDRVSDLPNLVCLYPDQPRDLAFGKYYSQSNLNLAPPTGYVKPRLVFQIVGNQQGSPPHSNTPTPQPYYAHSSESGIYPSNLDGNFADHNSQMYESMKRRRHDDAHQHTWQQNTEA